MTSADSGVSPSIIVPPPVSSASAAPDGLLRITRKLSSASCSLSSRVGTEMVWTVSPSAKVKLPEAAV